MRQRLPDRRPALTFDIEHKGRIHQVTVGIDPASGRPVECFVHGAKAGSDADITYCDASVMLSLLLQHGADPVELSKSLLKEPDGRPASILGAVIELVAGMV